MSSKVKLYLSEQSFRLFSLGSKSSKTTHRDRLSNRRHLEQKKINSKHTRGFFIVSFCPINLLVQKQFSLKKDFLNLMSNSEYKLCPYHGRILGRHINF